MIDWPLILGIFIGSFLGHALIDLIAFLIKRNDKKGE